jgi:hypothetical protein
MKPFDTKGEYTPEEVKAALAGINGTRQLSFRYDRLDRNNQFIESIDYVSKCSIENNALADIKRTAKFDILDTGTINYLQDRIKPYMRITMPEDEGYSDVIETVDPDIWWKLDDPSVISNTDNPVTIADDLQYATRATAYNGTTTGGQSYIAQIQAGSGTLRNEFWVKYDVTTSEALEFKYFNKPANVSPCSITYEVYSAPTDEADLVLEYTMTSVYINTYSTSTITYPKKGLLYIRITTPTTANKSYFEVSAEKRTRIEDSSKNKVSAIARNWLAGQPGLIGGGSSAFKTPASSSLTSAGTISTDDNIGLKHEGSVIINQWIDPDATWMNQMSFGASTDVYVTSLSDWYMVAKVEGISSASTDVQVSLELNGFYSEILVPKEKLAVGPHMITYVYEPEKDKAELWIDGIFFAPFIDVANDPLSLGTWDFFETDINKVEVTAYGLTGSLTMDDVSIFLRPLAASTISALYAMGIAEQTGAKRSGYVEWPQGVFLLSSPTRTMVDGNTVTRSVEGYDQLVTLKEDSFDYRYSVKQGAKYTDAVRQVLQSAKMKNRYYFNETDFTYDPGTTVNSETSIYVDTLDTNPTDVWSKWGKSLKDIYLSAKIDGSTSSPARTLMMIEYVAGATTKTFSMEANGASGTIIMYDGPVGTSITRNVVNHAYWRMRESNGYFYWETSADYKVWTEQRKVKVSVESSSAEARFQFTAAHGVPMIGSGFHMVVAEAYDLVYANIADTATKLPTAMEWEPGTPKLTIINDLLAAINYDSATYNEDGMFIGRPYIAPSQRTPQFRYATDSTSVITGDIDQSVDLFAVPNKWVVVVSDPDRPMLVGTYTNSDPKSPTSTVSRGRTIIDYRTEQNAPNQLTLDAQAARLAFEASQVYESVEFDTALKPIHQNSDVYDVEVDGLGIRNKYSEIAWSMELKNGATMSHKIRRVVSV